jgi:hypothetical protein
MAECDTDSESSEKFNEGYESTQDIYHIEIILHCGHMTESPQHKQIREEVETDLKKKDYNIYSSHGHGDVALYRLVEVNEAGDKTAIKNPDVVGYKNDKAIIVEIERSNRPSLILGDIISAHISTHFAMPKQNLPSSRLPLIKIAVVLDEESIPVKGGKSIQFKVLKGALAKCGIEPFIGTKKEFFVWLKSDA